MALESVSVSIEYMIFSMIFSPLTILVLVRISYLVYSRILTNPDRLSAQDKNTTTLLRVAVCIWILIIIYQIIQNLFLNPLIIPKISQCTNSDCNYCEIFGRFEEFIITSQRGFVLLFLIQTLKYALHASGSCISHSLIALQSWTFLCFIGFCLALICSRFPVKIINDNNNYMVCGNEQLDVNSLKATWERVVCTWSIITVNHFIHCFDFIRSGNLETCKVHRIL